MAGKYKSAYYLGPEKTEHRLVWTNAFGKIPEGHDIHHKDGNKSNNDIENLECLPRSEHIRLHRTGTRISAENAEKLHNGSKERWKKYRGDIPNGHKKCSMCKRVLLIQSFYSNPSQHNGLAVYCKECQSLYMKEKRKKNIETLYVGERRCGKCGQVFDISFFPRNRAQYGGYGHYCKKCQSECNKKSLLRKRVI